MCPIRKAYAVLQSTAKKTKVKVAFNAMNGSRVIGTRAAERIADEHKTPLGKIV